MIVTLMVVVVGMGTVLATHRGPDQSNNHAAQGGTDSPLSQGPIAARGAIVYEGPACRAASVFALAKMRQTPVRTGDNRPKSIR
jgi:hypothetical protein